MRIGSTCGLIAFWLIAWAWAIGRSTIFPSPPDWNYGSVQPGAFLYLPIFPLTAAALILAGKNWGRYLLAPVAFFVCFWGSLWFAGAVVHMGEDSIHEYLGLDGLYIAFGVAAHMSVMLLKPTAATSAD